MMPTIKTHQKHYRIDGIKYDRVTEIIGDRESKGLATWRNKVGVKEAKRISQEAKRIGSRVDTLTQRMVNNQPLRLTANDAGPVTNCMRAFQQWQTDEAPPVVDMQRTLWHDELRIAGTLDMLLQRPRNQQRTLLDIKTSQKVKLDHWVQVAVYAWLLEQQTGQRVEHIAILRLDKSSGLYEYPTLAYAEYGPMLLNLFWGRLNDFRMEYGYHATETEDKSGSVKSLYTQIAQQVVEPMTDVERWRQEI